MPTRVWLLSANYRGEVKKFPKLQLVQRSERQERPQKGSFASLEIVNFADIAQIERKKVEKIVQHTVPGAGILGLVNSPRPWDLRPIVVTSTEEESGPSVIRFFGPEVTLSIPLTSKLTDLLKRTSTLSQSSVPLLQWGILEGQLWYRRPLIARTLAERLNEGEGLSFIDALKIARSIIKIVHQWHGAGIFHGHICASNVALGEDFETALLDAGIGGGIVQACAALEMEEFPLGYERSSFAPEILRGGEISAAADVYGVGRVFWDLFGRVARVQQSSALRQDDTELSYMLPDDTKRLKEVISSMTAKSIANRPPLRAVYQVMNEFLGMSESAPPKRVVKTSPVVQERRPAQLPAIVEKPVESRVNRPQSEELLENKADLERASELPPQLPQADVMGRMSEKYNQTYSQPVKPRGNNNWILVLLAGLVIAALVYRLTQSQGADTIEFGSEQDIVSTWESGVPSEMSLVAISAVEDNSWQKVAQRVVLKSAEKNTGGAGERLVNKEFLRLAFSPRWEMQLSDLDRKTAMMLALARLLPEESLKLDTDLAALHPGVILAAATVLPNNKALAAIPVDRLLKLPEPLSFAFAELLRHSPNMKVTDPTVGEIANIALASQGNITDQLVAFISRDPGNNLRVLATLFAFDGPRARSLVDLLVNHPNVKIDYPTVIWAREMAIGESKTMTAFDQLNVMAGLPPQGKLSAIDSVKLLSHPSTEVRRVGIGNVLEVVKLSHPGAFTVLSLLKDRPEMLTGPQTLVLTDILERHQTVEATRVQAWLDTDPPLNLLSTMIVSTAKEAKPARLDSAVYFSLKNRGWEPSDGDLEKLINHPEGVIRLAVYTKLFTSGNSARANTMLSAQLEREKNPQYRAQLEQMLRTLRQQQTTPQ